MLSPYIGALYIMERLIRGEKQDGYLDALAWLCCVFGILILSIRRLKGNNVESLIFSRLLGISSDIPIYVFKIILLLYIHNRGPFSDQQIHIAGIVVIAYLYCVDTRWVYEI